MRSFNDITRCSTPKRHGRVVQFRTQNTTLNYLKKSIFSSCIMEFHIVMLVVYF